MYKFVCDPDALFNMAYGGGNGQQDSQGMTRKNSNTTTINNAINAQERNPISYYGNLHQNPN